MQPGSFYIWEASGMGLYDSLESLFIRVRTRSSRYLFPKLKTARTEFLPQSAYNIMLGGLTEVILRPAHGLDAGYKVSDFPSMAVTFIKERRGHSGRRYQHQKQHKPAAEWPFHL